MPRLLPRLVSLAALIAATAALIQPGIAAAAGFGN
jgi:hypothetical protein